MIIGWIGNAFLIWGSVAVGNKRRSAFAVIAIGEALWVWRSFELGSWDGVFLCSVFLVLQWRNFICWK